MPTAGSYNRNAQGDVYGALEKESVARHADTTYSNYLDAAQKRLKSGLRPTAIAGT